MLYISHISFKMNTHPEEAISVGIVFIKSDGSAKVMISDKKMNILKKIINKPSFTLFNFTIESMVKSPDIVDLEMLYRMNIYQNGILKIGKPIKLNISEDDDKLEAYFKKVIEPDIWKM